MGTFSTLAWWLGFFYLSGTTFLILRPYLSKLHDQGYALAKILGLLGFTYILWLLASLKIMSFGVGSASLLAVVMGVLAIWQWRRHPLQDISYRKLLAEEAVFALALAAWAIVRSYNGRAEGVEKMMDVALVNGLMRTEFFPPTDVWYASDPINYYYYGQMLVAALAKLTHVAPQYAVNLGLASTFALCVILGASLIWQLTRSYLSAVVGVFLLTLSSNLDPAIAGIKQVKDYIFFAATRLDPYTINEFPLYSFVVADLHAHTLGLPIVLGIITLLWVVLESKKLIWPVVLGLGLLLGATGPTNSFDLIVYGGLTGLILLIRAYSQTKQFWPSLVKAFWQAGGIAILAGALYLPFYLNFHAPVGGVGIQLFKTSLPFILINFGVLLFICLPILPMSLPPLNFLKQKGKVDQTEQPSTFELLSNDWFAISLVVMALLLIIATEFVYLKDIYTYQNPPYARANTIFKVYFQAWVMLSLAAGYGLYLARHIKLKWHLNVVYLSVVGAMIGLSLMGTWSAVKAYKDSKPVDRPAWILDGYHYLTYENPDQLALIHYINEKIEGQPLILEAAGESYSQRSKISSYTGLPTTLGWASHEWGWRYSSTAWDVIAGKMGQIEQTYKASDPATMQRLLQEQGISYVVATDVEREQYGMSDFAVLEQLAGEPVFEQGNYALYKIP